MLKGTGTRASKSRLTAFGAREGSLVGPFESSKGKTRRFLWLLLPRKKSAARRNCRTGRARSASDGGLLVERLPSGPEDGWLEGRRKRDLCLAVSGGERGLWGEIGDAGWAGRSFGFLWSAPDWSRWALWQMRCRVRGWPAAGASVYFGGALAGLSVYCPLKRPSGPASAPPRPLSPLVSPSRPPL